MKRTTALLTVLMMCGINGALTAQKYKSKFVNFEYYEYPKVLLDTPAYRTYSVTGNLPDYMGGGYALARQQFGIGSLRRSPQPGGDIEVLLNIGYYAEDPYARPSAQQGSQNVKINGRDSSVPVFSYQGSVYQPFEYVLRDNIKGKDLLNVSNRRRMSFSTDWYRSSEEALRNWESAMRSGLARQSEMLIREINGGIQAQASSFFYKGPSKSQVEVMYMKDKDEYADLDSAFQMAMEAYPQITAAQKGQHDAFAKAIAPAEAIWLRALAQHEPGSKKARINDKVANLILFNLAWASFWKNDFSKAMECADRAGENDKRDGWVPGFERMVKDRRERLNNSNLKQQ